MLRKFFQRQGDRFLRPSSAMAGHYAASISRPPNELGPTGPITAEPPAHKPHTRVLIRTRRADPRRLRRFPPQTSWRATPTWPNCRRRASTRWTISFPGYRCPFRADSRPHSRCLGSPAPSDGSFRQPTIMPGCTTKCTAISHCGSPVAPLARRRLFVQGVDAARF